MIFLKLLQPLGNDFVVYFESAKMFLMGLNPYQGLITRTFPLNYPPPVLLFLSPLGLFDFNTASILWNIFSTISLLTSVWLLLKIINRASLLNFIVTSFLFTLPFFPVKNNIGNGQINLFIMLFCVASLYFYEKGKHKTSVLLLAFATSIKLAPGIFVLYFVLRRDWKQVWRFLLALGFCFLAPLLFISWNYQKDYYTDIIFWSFTMGAKDWYYNQSLFGFLARTFSQPVFVQAMFYGLTVLILFFSIRFGQNLPRLRQMAVVSCLYLLIHPIALQHYFGFSIIPFIILGFNRYTILAYLLIACDIKNFSQVRREFNFILSHNFFGILLLWVNALWDVRTIRVVGAVWVVGIALLYLFTLLCRGGFCF